MGTSKENLDVDVILRDEFNYKIERGFSNPEKSAYEPSGS